MIDYFKQILFKTEKFTTFKKNIIHNPTNYLNYFQIKDLLMSIKKCDTVENIYLLRKSLLLPSNKYSFIKVKEIYFV